MEQKLKTISPSGIAQALSKAQVYRYLKEPEESESICQDILAADPENQAALRLLGLSITDQFTGESSDRCAEAESAFRRLTHPYAQHYYLGILLERRAKAQMRNGRPAYVVEALIEEAMLHFEEAEKIRPADNDESVLRWNRCVRLLAKLPHAEVSEGPAAFEDQDIPPVPARPAGARR
jgi:tetratricopeptide (TPR) repeat protein